MKPREAIMYSSASMIGFGGGLFAVRSKFSTVAPIGSNPYILAPKSSMIELNLVSIGDIVGVFRLTRFFSKRYRDG